MDKWFGGFFAFGLENEKRLAKRGGLRLLHGTTRPDRFVHAPRQFIGFYPTKLYERSLLFRSAGFCAGELSARPDGGAVRSPIIVGGASSAMNAAWLPRPRREPRCGDAGRPLLAGRRLPALGLDRQPDNADKRRW